MTHFLRHIVHAAAMMAGCGFGVAEAAQVRLTYLGNPVDLVSPPADPFQPVYPAFSGEIVLEESLLGGSVAGRTLTFFGFRSPSDPFDDTVGILSWTLGVPLYSVAGTDVSITFGASREVLGWVFDAMDGPPDFYSSPSGDQVFGGNGGFYATQAGTWTTTLIGAEVPVPASVLLLVSGLGGLVGVARKRRRACTA